MLETGKIEVWQKEKKISLLVIVGVGLSAILCCVLRFVPGINDRVSGRPEYMRWIADRFAQSVAAKVGDEFAVIATSDENSNCRQTTTAPFDSDDVYYVVTYSGVANSVCFLIYAKEADGSGQVDSLILNQNSGHNYGRRLAAPVKVVPVGQVLIRFPVSYLSLLHWRAKIDAPSMARAGSARIERSVSVGEAVPVSMVDIPLDFQDLRRAVAQRHHTMNTLLTSLIFLSLLLISGWTGRTWILYRKFRQFCLPYDPTVGLWTFLRHDLQTIGDDAERNYHDRQQQALEQARAASLLRRLREVTRGRLESLLSVVPDEEQRGRVLESLRDDDLGKMKSLLQELECQFGQQTPEERLAALLESAKPYCTSEEFQQCRVEAFKILAEVGFRQARVFVVTAHDQLRLRSKELEKQEVKEAN